MDRLFHAGHGRECLFRQLPLVADGADRLCVRFRATRSHRVRSRESCEHRPRARASPALGFITMIIVCFLSITGVQPPAARPSLVHSPRSARENHSHTRSQWVSPQSLRNRRVVFVRLGVAAGGSLTDEVAAQNGSTLLLDAISPRPMAARNHLCVMESIHDRLIGAKVSRHRSFRAVRGVPGPPRKGSPWVARAAVAVRSARRFRRSSRSGRPRFALGRRRSCAAGCAHAPGYAVRRPALPRASRDRRGPRRPRFP